MRFGNLLFHTLRLKPARGADALATDWRTTPADGLMPLLLFEGAAAWLQRRLTETGLEAAAPTPFLEALRARIRKEAATNLLVDEEVVRVVRLLTDARVPNVLLKGNARRAAAARWPCADARYTSDVDVIVPAAESQRAWDLLTAAGYSRATDALSPHELPALIGPARISVDIHISLAHRLPADEAWRRVSTNAIEIPWQGMVVRVPNATEMLWHAVTHALQHGVIAWRLRFFQDGASILGGADAIDWETIRRRVAAREISDVTSVQRWLGSAADLAGVTLPADVSNGAPPFGVANALQWRAEVLARRTVEGYGGRLLEEGTRVELGWDPAPAAEHWSPLMRMKRRLAGQAARLAYRRWQRRSAAATSGAAGL